MDTDKILTVLSVIATWAAVIAALLAVWLQNRHSKRLTSLQLFIQLAAQYDSKDMQQTRAELANKLLSEPTTLEINERLLVFYENIAILHRQNLLDYTLLINTFSDDVRTYWEALRHYIEYMRKTFNEPRYYIEFEQLNNYFIADARKYAPNTNIGLTKESIQQFLKNESLRGN